MSALQLKKVSREVFTLLAIFANYTFLGPVKMTIEAIRGRTFSGETLTLFGRMNHMIIQTTNVISYILFFQGRFQIAGWIFAFSWLDDSIQYYREILGSIGKLCGSLGMIRVSRAIATTITWIDRQGTRKLFFK
jgi:hypothetical protein